MGTASQKHPQWRHTRSDITYLTTSNYNALPSAVKGPVTSYPAATNQTPTGERPPFHSRPQPIAPVSTGTFKCRHPGCTAAPFDRQYYLQHFGSTDMGLSSFTAPTQMSIRKIDHTFVPSKDVLEELVAKDLNARMR